MADIQNEIKTIEEAARGEEVRDAIIDALKGINTSVEEASYTLSISGKVISLTDKRGNVQSVEITEDTNTTYTMTLEGTTLKLTDSDGKVQSVPVVADTSALEARVKKNEDNLGGLKFSITDAGLLHIEEVMDSGT